MEATEELKNEHRVIERMLKVLTAAANRLEHGEDVPSEVWPQAVDFIRTFADYCHHGKEEDLLFGSMERHGIPRDGGPIAVMLMEHDQGRSFVKGIEEASQKLEQGDSSAAAAVAQNARGYAELLTEHILKEDNILYEMANQAIPPEEQRQLAEQFEQVERERIGEGKHDEYVRLVEELERKVGT
jgi:hemerythrin-like domain-containing protein